MSQSGPPPNDNNSVIIAGGCSRYDNNTDVTSIGTVTAALQLQQERSDQIISSNVLRPSGDRPVTHVLPGPQSVDQSLLATTQHDVTLTTDSFNSSGAGGRVILGDIRGARLAFESDNLIAGFPTVMSCLLTLQPLPTEFSNGL